MAAILRQVLLLQIFHRLDRFVKYQAYPCCIPDKVQTVFPHRTLYRSRQASSPQEEEKERQTQFFLRGFSMSLQIHPAGRQYGQPSSWS